MTATLSKTQTLILLKGAANSDTWYVNGKEFHTGGGLYAAMDIALAYGLGRTDITDLPPLQWSYHAESKTYELELPQWQR